MKKLTWLHDLQNFAGVLIGLIMISIGSVMFLNAFAKLYVFGYTSSAYFSAEDNCRNNVLYEPAPLVFEKTQRAPKDTKKTPEEMKKCIEKAEQKEEKRYTRDKTEDIINGFILIIIGFPLWFFHRQRKEEEAKEENKNKNKK